jgi:hypothetical protein
LPVSTTPSKHMSSLNSLIDRAQSFAPTYSKRHLSNHLPMALVALHALGASDEQLEHGFARFSQKLEPITQDSERHPDWTECRGQREAFTQVRAQLSHDISKRGIDAALRAALPYLIDGVGGAAFHGLLRTASATVARHNDELASGLAHWVCSHMPLVPSLEPNATGETSASPHKLGLHEWLSEITSSPVPWKSPDGMIASLMQNCAASESFQATAARLNAHDGTLRELANLAIGHYLRSRNFTVLHLVTGSHAMRILLPYFDAPMAAVHHFAIAFAAGVAASGIDADAPLLPSNPQHWQALKVAACNADDQHVIKLVYACHEEFLVTGDERYRFAATLVLDRN